MFRFQARGRRPELRRQMLFLQFGCVVTRKSRRSPFLLPRFLDFCISFIKSVYCLFCWYVCTHIHTSSIIRLPTFPLIFSIFQLSFPFSSICFSAYIQHQPSPCFCVYVLFVGLICKSRILIYCWYSFA